MNTGKSLSFCATCYLFGVTAIHGLGQDLNTEFNEWAIRQRKSYQDETHRKNAFKTWLSNIKVVEDINNSNLTWTATIENQFGDITPEEFQRIYLLPKQHKEDIRSTMRQLLQGKSATVAVTPDNKVSFANVRQDEVAFDWRDHGAVTAVHDQGSVGTCW